VPSRPTDTDPAHPWTEKVLPTQLEAIRDAEGDVMARLEELGYDEDNQFAIRLAFEEALVNAMKHGNRMDPARKVTLAYRVSPECIEIRVRDEGPGFDPGVVPDPTVDENLQRPCGRGIMLMRSYMDAVTYACCGKEVRMTKYRRPSQGGAKP
jgi:serine/threonine-protein kinase RsbW